MMDMQKRFYKDVVEGLSATPKHLLSKYFYDEAGDKLFQKIMRCPEYYLTRCEDEILSIQGCQIGQAIADNLTKKLDVIGLGAGDGTKTTHLLKAFAGKDIVKAFYPVDISCHIINMLEKQVPLQFPHLVVKGWNGEYIQMLEKINQYSGQPKMILFLGSNIGNYSKDHAPEFCNLINQQLKAGDFLFIGFDLKKHPQTILNAYNDKGGFTKAFNLNLLTRINRELNGDFKIPDFDHYSMYDPNTGACKSYLVSLKEQVVHIGNDYSVTFYKNETMQMEISQKYTPEEIRKLALNSGFTTLKEFYDSKNWFVDCLWQKI